MKTSKLKLFGKIHLFDIIVLLFVLVILVGGINRISGGKLISSITGDTERKIEVKVMTDGYSEESLKSIRAGEVLSENKQYLDGEIKSVEIVDRMVSFQDENGEIVFGKDPMYSQALVTLTCTCKYREPVYSLGKQEYIPGSVVFLTTSRLNLKSTVISVEELK